MPADPSGSNTISAPARFDASAMIKERAASWVHRRINQQIRSDYTRQSPAVAAARPIASPVTPPAELARWLFTTLIHDLTRCPRKVPAAHTIEHSPTHRNHSATPLASCLKVQVERETTVLLPIGSGTCVTRVHLHEKSYQQSQ